MGVPKLWFSPFPHREFYARSARNYLPHRSDISPQTSHPASPAVGLQETRDMLPNNARLTQSPPGGLMHRPHSLSTLNGGISRGESRCIAIYY